MTRMILRRRGVRPGSPEPPCLPGRACALTSIFLMFEYANRISCLIKYIFDCQPGRRPSQRPGRPPGEHGRSSMSSVPRLLVVHHTPSPAMQAMLEAAVAGARDPELSQVTVVVT